MIQSALWRRLGGAFAGVLVLAVGVAVPRAVAAEPSTQPSDELVKQFAECLEVRTDRDRTGQVSRRAREELLFSLRQLKDQRLKPLFAELAASKRADFRRHGILGLAELSEDHRLNVLMVAKLEDPAEQALILNEAMGAELVADEQVAEILAWPGLEPAVEMRLRLRLNRAGGGIDEARLKTLAESNSTPTSVMAKLCLAEVGDPEAAAQAYTKLKELDESHRALLLAMMLELIRVEKLEKSGPFVTAAMKENEETWPAYREGLRTLFAIAPEAASAEWVKKYAEASDLSSRLRLAMVALEAGGKTSDAVCEALEHAQGSELLNAMGQALRACDGDSGMAAAAYLALARQGYRDSIGWLLAQSKELPEPQRLEVAIGVIENMMEAKARGEALAGIVGVAAKIVGETDPPAILPTLKRACEGQTDSIAREIVAGLLFSGTRPAWNSKNAPKWPDALCEAMATLYEAKTFPGYLDDAAKREKLRRIATGWGSLPDDFKVQAAWLVLAAEGRDRETLTRLLTEVGGE